LREIDNLMVLGVIVIKFLELTGAREEGEAYPEWVVGNCRSNLFLNNLIDQNCTLY